SCAAFMSSPPTPTGALSSSAAAPAGSGTPVEDTQRLGWGQSDEPLCLLLQIVEGAEQRLVARHVPDLVRHFGAKTVVLRVEAVPRRGRAGLHPLTLHRPPKRNCLHQHLEDTAAEFRVLVNHAPRLLHEDGVVLEHAAA